MPRALAGARAGWHPLVLVPLALTAWVYHPITGTFFFADDFVHLTEIVNEGPLLFLLRPFGGQAFLGRNLVFLATYKVFGVDPVPFMWSVLATHLLNVALLFGLLRELTRSVWLGCLGAAVWGASPLAVGTLDWYAAFGHVLVGTTLLLALRGAVRVANAGEPIPRRAAVAWYVLLLVGTTCYGPGMGVACAFPVALGLLVPSAWRQRGVRYAFLALPLATLAIYVTLRRVYALIGEMPLEEAIQQAIAFSGFTRAPILFFYFLLHSSASAVLGFFMPPIDGNLAPWIAAGAFTAAVALLLWRGSWPMRRAALAMAALWGGTYLVIATGRANIFAVFSIPPPVAAATERYHYAAAIPLVVLLCLALQQVGRLPGLGALPRGLVVAAVLGVLVYGHEASGFRIEQHALVHDWFLVTQREIANAVAATPPGTPVYIENRTTPRLLLGPALPDRMFPGRAGVFLLAGPKMHLDGREIRFVERDPEVLASQRHTRLGRILVAPGDVPANVTAAP